MEMKDLVAGSSEQDPRRRPGTTIPAVKIDAIDEVRLMAGFQKLANRITLGLLLAL